MFKIIKQAIVRYSPPTFEETLVGEFTEASEAFEYCRNRMRTSQHSSTPQNYYVDVSEFIKEQERSSAR